MIYRRRRFKFHRVKRTRISRLQATIRYKQWLKDRGQLRCEVCGWSDPTILPYFLIEVHHCKRVSDGGGHDFSNLLALCPNQHNLADRLSRKNRHLNITKNLMVQLIREHEFNRDLKIV